MQCVEPQEAEKRSRASPDAGDARRPEAGNHRAATAFSPVGIPTPVPEVTATGGGGGFGGGCDGSGSDGGGGGGGGLWQPAVSGPSGVLAIRH